MVRTVLSDSKASILNLTVLLCSTESVARTSITYFEFSANVLITVTRPTISKSIFSFDLRNYSISIVMEFKRERISVKRVVC